MIRTQLYLPKEEHRELIQVAKQKKQPMAEVIRTFIKRGLKLEKSIDRTGREAMRALANLKLKGGPADLSQNLDHYLYGASKKDI